MEIQWIQCYKHHFLLLLWGPFSSPKQGPDLRGEGHSFQGLGPLQTRSSHPCPHTHPHGVMDPVQQLSNLGVDTGVIGLCAATAPADHPYQVPGAPIQAHQGAPTITLRA